MKKVRYCQRVLGYRPSRLTHRPSFDIEQRIAILYDHVVHGSDVYQLITKYNSNYSSIRHILVHYNRFGKTDRRKYKQIYYDGKVEVGS